MNKVLDTVPYVDPGFVAPTSCSRGVLTTNEIDTLKKLVLKITGIPYNSTNLIVFAQNKTSDNPIAL